MRALLLTMLPLLSMAAPALAQPATDSAPKATYNEEARRRNSLAVVRRRQPQFVEIYKLTPEQTLAIQKLMNELVDKEVEYFRQNDTELQELNQKFMEFARRRRVAQNENAPAEEIENLRKEQLQARSRYVELSQSGTPLNIENIATELEKLLPPEQAQEGRKEFDRRRPYDLMSPDVINQNRNNQVPVQPTAPLRLSPEQANPARFRSVSGVAPSLPRWKSAIEAIIKVGEYNADQSATSRKLIEHLTARAEKAMRAGDNAAELPNLMDRLYDELQLRVIQLATPPQREKILAAASHIAPPLDRWEHAVNKIVDERNYDPEQTTSARGILTESKAEATKYREDNAEAFSKAAAIEGPGKREEELAKLEKPIDEMFAKMIERVEKLSRSEQIPRPLRPEIPESAEEKQEREAREGTINGKTGEKSDGGHDDHAGHNHD